MPSAAAPVIAVTATEDVLDDGRRRVRVNEPYVAALSAAGAVALVVPSRLPDGAAQALLARVDGLLLTGGSDVEARRYGQPAHPANEPPERERDALELALLAAAQARALPTLAICRGVQLFNVFHGGTLVQDIPTERPDALAHNPPDARTRRVHAVRLADHSRLAAAVGTTTLAVNSFHHQAVAHPGSGLRVVATAPDGLVEGLESATNEWWAVGVQWHPEELVGTDEPWDRALFAAFVREAAKARALADG